MSELNDKIMRAIAKEAEKLARDFFDSMAIGHPDELTAARLMELHPELDAEEAELYRLFCKQHTITFCGCYGQGQIMWPKWQAFKAEIQAL